MKKNLIAPLVFFFSMLPFLVAQSQNSTDLADSVQFKRYRVKFINESSEYNCALEVRKGYEEVDGVFMPKVLNLGRVAFNETKYFEFLALENNAVVQVALATSDVPESCGSFSFYLEGEYLCASRANNSEFRWGRCFSRGESIEVTYSVEGESDDADFTIRFSKDPCEVVSSASRLSNPIGKFIRMLAKR